MSPVQGVLLLPMPTSTAPPTQPQPPNSNAPGSQSRPTTPNALGSQSAPLGQQPHAISSIATQTVATAVVTAVQPKPTKLWFRTWPWFCRFSRLFAALLASGSIILFIYYQLRADRRDVRIFDYTTRSWNLSVWTARKDYCDFQLSHHVSLPRQSPWFYLI